MKTFEDFAQKHLDIHSVNGDEAMVRCIAHDESRASMQYNLSTGQWVCFACGAGGGMKSLCRELGIEVSSDPEPQLQDIYRALRELKHPTRKGQPKPLPEATLKRYTIPTNYWRGRGFSEQTIKAFGLGYDVMNDAVTIPIRDDDGRLLGVIRRYLDEDEELRYKYPKGFKRSWNLFGSWLVDNSPSDFVALVEGSVDAMKCWQAGVPALACYGSSISPMQVRLLRRLGVGQIGRFGDRDKAGKKFNDSMVGIKYHRSKKRGIWTEYVPEMDLRRWFLLYDMNYESGWAGDPGALKMKQIKKAYRNKSLV